MLAIGRRAMIPLGASIEKANGGKATTMTTPVVITAGIRNGSVVIGLSAAFWGRKPPTLACKETMEA